MSERQINLDLMRFLGVVIIIIAHANPPGWLFQLRNFGTPLLIVASALTYSLIYSKREIQALNFCFKRLERLVFPAWIFLTFFFLFFFFCSLISRDFYRFSFVDIVYSYAFYEGIGFVWIFKVYIVLALITPLALKIRDIDVPRWKYFLFLLLSYVFYEFAVLFFRPMVVLGYENFFDSVVFILFPYSILYLYGMRLNELSNREIFCLMFASLFVFILLAFYFYYAFGRVVSTQEFKYPPRIYYISYAFFALNAVWLVCKNLPKFNSRFNVVILWLSSRALWIYLWHIMAFYLLFFTVGETDGLAWFLIKAICMMLFSVLATYLQEVVVVKCFSKDSHFGRKMISLLT